MIEKSQPLLGFFFTWPNVPLSNDIMGDFAVDVGESKIPAGVLVSQFLVIQTQKVKDGGMEVMEVHAVFHRSHAVLIVLEQVAPHCVIECTMKRNF